MPRFRPRVTITASQWFANGDHPDDGLGAADTEGRVVRYFRHPEIPGDGICGLCDRRIHDHGWLDTGGEGQRVCPGDWVVTGLRNKRWAVKPAEFEATYERVET